MYTPPAFKEETLSVLHDIIEAASLSTLVTATADGLLATPLPLLLDRNEGPNGTLYGHVARANPQGTTPVIGAAMATFMGPDAYVTPSWYASKREHGKVVPTWNYVAVHAYGAAEFFTDEDRLLDIVTRLTNRHEAGRAEPWQVSDAPAAFVKAQLRGIIGLRLPIERLDGKPCREDRLVAEEIPV
jgi:transcriptional regulator